MENTILSWDYAAYIPCYDNGNLVMAIKKDGQAVIIKKSIKAVMANILKENSLNMQSIKKNFSMDFCNIKLMPIPISLDSVLIPVKMRKAVNINDGTYGYLDIYCIKKVSGEKQAVITLTSGSHINCLETVRTIMRRMHKGKQMGAMLSSHMLGECSLKDGMDSMDSEYRQAATKGDITMLAYEIMKLRASFQYKNIYIEDRKGEREYETEKNQERY